MEVNNSVLQIVDQLINDVCDQTSTDTSSTTSTETSSNNHGYDHQDEQQNNHQNEQQNDHQDEQQNDHQDEQIDNEGGAAVENIVPIVNKQTTNDLILLKIDQINTDIDFIWKIQAIISYTHPNRPFENENGIGQVSTWDLTDDTGSINLVAFNLNSYLMCTKLVEGKSYEFTRLSIRPVDDHYKNLPHEYQLLVTNTTNVQEIVLPFKYELTYDFTHLNQIETIPLYSIIDVNVLVIRDYGVTAGSTNNNTWRRRELHVAQDGVQIRLTLWNDKVKIVQKSMVNMQIKIKNVKVSWFNGSRTLATLGNTRLSIV